MGSPREWTANRCVGLPYALASRIIEEIYICPVCRRQYEQEEFQQHINDTKHVTELEDGRKYRNIIVLQIHKILCTIFNIIIKTHSFKLTKYIFVEHGHFEINMTKALFKLL